MSVEAERFERGHVQQAGDNQKRVGGQILLVIMDFSDLRPSSPPSIWREWIYRHRCLDAGESLRKRF